jgi:hypothetical protein
MIDDSNMQIFIDTLRADHDAEIVPEDAVDGGYRNPYVFDHLIG